MFKRNDISSDCIAQTTENIHMSCMETECKQVGIEKCALVSG